MREILRLTWERFKIIAAIVGDAQANLIAILLYFTVLAPFGLMSRLSSDPLRLAPPTSPITWLEREPIPDDLEIAKRQG